MIWDYWCKALGRKSYDDNKGPGEIILKDGRITGTFVGAFSSSEQLPDNIISSSEQLPANIVSSSEQFDSSDDVIFNTIEATNISASGRITKLHNNALGEFPKLQMNNATTTVLGAPTIEFQSESINNIITLDTIYKKSHCQMIL